MRLLFILPYDNTYRYQAAFVPSISYQPLTLSALATLVPPELAGSMTLVDEGVCRYNYEKEQYDIVFISIVTSSASRGYELADFFRIRGAYVCIGGHHATLLPDEATLHADSVFTGPAEQTLIQFFEDYQKNSTKKRYDGNPCVNSISLPRRDLMQQKGYLSQPTIIADYGCHNDCKYCVIPSYWGKNARRSVDSVLNEMRMLHKKEFLFLDPSPFGDLNYATELLDGMKKLNVNWAGLCTLDTAFNPELLQLLSESGCVGMLMGFESFSQEDIFAMNKYKNRVDTYKTAVYNMHTYGMAVLGTFMLGMDSDTVESLLELPSLIAEAKIDIPRFAIITPWPSTSFYNELQAQERILHRDWRKYDSVHCVFQPKNMTPGELEHAFIKVWKDCYRPAAILKRLSHTPQKKLTALITNIGFSVYAGRVDKLL